MSMHQFKNNKPKIYYAAKLQVVDKRFGIYEKVVKIADFIKERSDKLIAEGERNQAQAEVIELKLEIEKLKKEHVQNGKQRTG